MGEGLLGLCFFFPKKKVFLQMLEKNKHIYTWKIKNNNLFLTENYVKFEEKFLIFHQKKIIFFFVSYKKKSELGGKS